MDKLRQNDTLFKVVTDITQNSVEQTELAGKLYLLSNSTVYIETIQSFEQNSLTVSTFKGLLDVLYLSEVICNIK